MKSPTIASRPATDQTVAVVAAAVLSASCAAAAPLAYDQSQRPGTSGLTAAAQVPSGDSKIGPRPSEPIAVRRRSRSGSVPASMTARVPSESSTAPRDFSASLRTAPSSIGFASSSTAGVDLPGRSTSEAAAANGQPLPITMCATASCRSRASRTSRSEKKSAFFIPSMTSSLSVSKATA